MCNKLLSVFLSLFLFTAVNGQTSQFQFSQLDVSNGLSHNQVTAIHKDAQGFMWFGTMSGLNRYDGSRFKIFKHKSTDSTSINDDFIESIQEGPEEELWVLTRYGLTIYDPRTERFRHNIEAELRKFKIPGQHVNSMRKDKTGTFWFVVSQRGIYRYNALTKKTFHYQHSKNNRYSLDSGAVSSIAEDVRGDFWVVYRNGLINRIDSRSNKVNYRSDVLAREMSGKNLSFALTVDREGDLWVYDRGSDVGLYRFSPKTKKMNHFSKGSATGKLNSNIISNVIQDNAGLIWVATDHGGINLLDKTSLRTRYLVNQEDDNRSIKQNSIVSLFKDNDGIVWIGTFKKGISYYHPAIKKFPLTRHYGSNLKSLPHDDVNRFCEDAKGNLWLGTNGGGLIYFNRITQEFTRYKHDAADKNSLSNDVIVSLHIDHRQRLWIGTFFGGLDCFDGKKFTHFRHDERDSTSISDDRIWEIFEDSAKRLWIGTLTGGLNRLDEARKVFSHYEVGPNSVHSTYFSSILEDRAGNIWLGGSYGIDVLLKKTNKFIHFLHDDADPQSLIHNNVTNMIQDRRGFIWVGTREGLGMLNPRTGKFKNFQKADGLPDNNIADLQEDNNNNLWISTSNGLSNLIISKQEKGRYNYRFKNYDESDGLAASEFNESASLKTRMGELIFGGANGFNIFQPDAILSSTVHPPLVLTDFQIFNDVVTPGKESKGQVVLAQSITQSKSVTLNYDENVFTIEFAALYFFNNDKLKIEYMLDDFDKTWLTADKDVRKVTYTNLDPGSYTFKLRSTNEEGVYGSKVLEFHVLILPPVWKTGYAYLAYIILFAGTLIYIRRRGIHKIRTQFVIEQQRQEAKKLLELDRMKMQFVTNVSHEFRTPLSLILAPVDNLLKLTDEPEQIRQVQMISRNARRLLNLVNQLLDFGKLEDQELRLHPVQDDIIGFIKEVAYSFMEICEKKNIRFVFDSTVESVVAEFDPDKIERILLNLLSNSIKFSHAGGQISVLLDLIEQIGETTKILQIKVIDTGIGIPVEKQAKVFERFFQHHVPNSLVNSGSGIGLSITQEFVKLHGGKIDIQSDEGEGCCFTVSLPVKTNVITAELAGEESALEEKASLEKVTRPSGKQPLVLIIEDNDDFRLYLKDHLKETFKIVEAANGKEGWQKALALHPNLIVSDITMPEMDGIALCRKLKSDPRTSYIPVILLTAISGEEQQLAGLDTGATDYMTKPFNFDILLSKIKNILIQQESMRQTYRKQLEITPSQIPVDSPNEEFVQKVLLIIEKNISSPEFSVEDLSAAMFMSRVTLYKKILAATGKSPVEFIRSVRIKRAAQLLEQGHLTISQIGYNVGFKSQKYFVRSFKMEYNILPSAYREQAMVKDPQVGI